MKVDYIALSIPIFFILIGIELVYSYVKKVQYYRLNDSISNLSQGIGQQLIGVFMKTILFFGYTYLYEHARIFDIPTNIFIWVILFLGVDFLYYWFHRMSHQVNALWAAHVVHHQSEEYNYTVALRQSWFQSWFSWIFYLPLAIIGFDPMLFLTLVAFNTLYQFGIHTKMIGQLGWLEYIINTPSHHRVHHGSNPKYIDKNHGGTLIIWDRLFGTFQKEEERVYYGITKPLASWNPVWANFQYWFELILLAKRMKGLKDTLLVFIKQPGWQPEYAGGALLPPDIDEATYHKYDEKCSDSLMAYSFFQFIIALALGSVQLFLSSKIEFFQTVSLTFFVILTLVSCGAFFERSRWLRLFELGRLILSLGLLLLFWTTCPLFWKGVFAAIHLLSFIWFLLIINKIATGE